MTVELIEYDLGDGNTILVEVNLPAASIQRAGREGGIAKAASTFDEALDQVKPVAERVTAKLRDLAEIPESIAVEFGIKLGAKAGVVIASADAEANFKVTLNWSRSTKAP